MYTYNVFYIKGKKQRVAYEKSSFKLKELKSESLSVESPYINWMFW